ASRSRPAACASRSASRTETSPPASAPSRMRRTSREARSSVAPGLPAAPVLMRLPHKPVGVDERGDPRAERLVEELRAGGDVRVDGESLAQDEADWKSTRLNSSHLGISYAVFCLKKKKQV